MKHDTRLLRNAQGTEGLLLEEAYSHLKRVQKIDSIFLSWGYLPSKTPVFDYHDLYKEYLSDNKNQFRLFDRDGELLVLRSDITLFLAKQLGMSLKSSDLPVRIFYGDSILRHQGQTDISKNEFFQMGAELIGVSGMRGDIEILALMTAVMDSFQLAYFTHVGSRDFFSLISKDMDANEKKSVAFWIKGREYKKVESALSKYFDKKQAVAISSLFATIGTVEEFEEKMIALKSDLTKPQIKTLEYLLDLMKVVQQLDNGSAFRVDLSEIGNRSYYTGISFSVYADGADSAVASGGRYDKLLERFGFSAPSTGFSLLIRKLEQLTGVNKVDLSAVKVSDENILKALQKAAEVRKKGGVAIL